MAAKLKAPRKKSGDALQKMMEKQMQLLRRELEDRVEESIKNATTDMEAQFSSLAANIASVVMTGKTDARSLANAAARSFAPMLKDFLNRSFSQQGDDVLGAIGKAQRNT